MNISSNHGWDFSGYCGISGFSNFFFFRCIFSDFLPFTFRGLHLNLVPSMAWFSGFSCKNIFFFFPDAFSVWFFPFHLSGFTLKPGPVCGMDGTFQAALGISGLRSLSEGNEDMCVKRCQDAFWGCSFFTPFTFRIQSLTLSHPCYKLRSLSDQSASVRHQLHDHCKCNTWCNNLDWLSLSCPYPCEAISLKTCML